MLTIEDESILEDFEKEEFKHPCPRKVINKKRTIYTSRNFRHPKNHAWGHPVLCDFGEARIGSFHAHEEIQPEIYKAPEIIMETGWSYSVDIWNTACMVSISPSYLDQLKHTRETMCVELIRLNRCGICLRTSISLMAETMKEIIPTVSMSQKWLHTSEPHLSSSNDAVNARLLFLTN